MLVCRAALSLSVALALIGAGPEDRQAIAPSTPTANQVVAWLPPRTRTVIVDNEPGRVDRSPPTSKATLATLSPGLAGVGFTEGLPTFEWQWMVHGAYGNRAARNLGLLPYSGCNIAEIGEADADRLKSYLQKKANHRGLVAGLLTYVLPVDEGGTPWTYYLAFDGDLLFCATDKAYLTEILARRKSAIPTTAPAWGSELSSFLETPTPFWAVHWFDAGHRDEAKAETHDPDAIGVVACLAADRKQMAITYVSPNPQALEIQSGWTDYLRGEKAPPPVSVMKLSDRATRVVLDAQAPRGEVAFLMLILALGHLFTI